MSKVYPVTSYFILGQCTVAYKDIEQLCRSLHGDLTCVLFSASNIATIM
jgi:hypothetical protein